MRFYVNFASCQSYPSVRRARHANDSWRRLADQQGRARAEWATACLSWGGAVSVGRRDGGTGVGAGTAVWRAGTRR